MRISLECQFQQMRIRACVVFFVTCGLYSSVRTSLADSTIDLGRGPVTIHVPASHDPGTPAPVAIVLHRFGGNGAEAETFFGFETAAETAGIIYAAPEGTDNANGVSFWNATDACCNFTNSTVDDSAYLRALLEAIRDDYNIDPQRTYVVGISNGGFMAYRMACDHADLVTGVVVVAGATFDNPMDCSPTAPVHVLHIHGTADGTISYSGGSLSAPYPGAVKSVETWAAYDECAVVPVAVPETLDLDADLAGEETTIVQYPDNCAPGGSAELWTVAGGPHLLNPTPVFGASITEFMLTHARPVTAPVPALSSWAMIALALMMLLAATYVIRSRERQDSARCCPNAPPPG